MQKDLEILIKSFLPESPEKIIEKTYELLGGGIININEFAHKHFYSEHKYSDIHNNRDFIICCCGVHVALRCYVYHKYSHIFVAYFLMDKFSVGLLSLMYSIDFEDECEMTRKIMLSLVDKMIESGPILKYDQQKIRELFEYPYYYYIHKIHLFGGIYLGKRGKEYRLCVNHNGGLYRRYKKNIGHDKWKTLKIPQSWRRKRLQP